MLVSGRVKVRVTGVVGTISSTATENSKRHGLYRTLIYLPVTSSRLAQKPIQEATESSRPREGKNITW